MSEDSNFKHHKICECFGNFGLSILPFFLGFPATAIHVSGTIGKDFIVCRVLLGLLGFMYSQISHGTKPLMTYASRIKLEKEK